MTLQPAYGRDYKSRAAVLADLKAGKDFIVADMWSPFDGKPVNLEQLKQAGNARGSKLYVRYSQNRKVAAFGAEDLA